MARIEVRRPAAADPAGVALLLSGPVGRELWPGEDADFAPPVRTGLGFTVEFSAAEEGRRAAGQLGIVPSQRDPGTSELRLVVISPGPTAALLDGHSRRFLDALAAAAQARSSAA